MTHSVTRTKLKHQIYRVTRKAGWNCKSSHRVHASTDMYIHNQSSVFQSHVLKFVVAAVHSHRLNFYLWCDDAIAMTQLDDRAPQKQLAPPQNSPPPLIHPRNPPTYKPSYRYTPGSPGCRRNYLVGSPFSLFRTPWFLF